MHAVLEIMHPAGSEPPATGPSLDPLRRIGRASRMLKNPSSPRLLKKAQMQGGAGCEVRGVLGPYAAAPRKRANAADGPFSAACYATPNFSRSARIWLT